MSKMDCVYAGSEAHQRDDSTDKSTQSQYNGLIEGGLI